MKVFVLQDNTVLSEEQATDYFRRLGDLMRNDYLLFLKLVDYCLENEPLGWDDINLLHSYGFIHERCVENRLPVFVRATWEPSELSIHWPL